MITRTNLTITTATGAAAGGSSTTVQDLRGKLHAIFYDGGFSAGASAIFKGAATGQTIAKLALAGKTDIYPRKRTCTPTGVSVSGLFEPFPLAGELVNVIIGSGGSAKTGVLTFLLDN